MRVPIHSSVRALSEELFALAERTAELAGASCFGQPINIGSMEFCSVLGGMLPKSSRGWTCSPARWTVVSPFLIQKYPVSQQAFVDWWRASKGSRFFSAYPYPPSPEYPITRVICATAEEWIVDMNKRYKKELSALGLTLRLPTEAEYEFAARGVPDGRWIHLIKPDWDLTRILSQFSHFHYALGGEILSPSNDSALTTLLQEGPLYGVRLHAIEDVRYQSLLWAQGSSTVDPNPLFGVPRDMGSRLWHWTKDKRVPSYDVKPNEIFVNPIYPEVEGPGALRSRVLCGGSLIGDHRSEAVGMSYSELGFRCVAVPSNTRALSV